MYRYYNANAVNRYTDDCVIRAISCATNKSWDYVYDYLSDLAQYHGTLLDKREFVRWYLDTNFERLNNVGYTVGETSAMYPNSTLLITMNGHITCSKNGIIYDTFDCRDRKTENAWLVR